ncbi:MAG: threonine-phosphate decarboxylase CobD [Ferrovibrio sp.]|uniref:threonine-phosphate decarboxylase CobD n=1 Tax=Ferrovibrio sp. TaxID=1917215 RepID=UPI00391C5C36
MKENTTMGEALPSRQPAPGDMPPVHGGDLSALKTMPGAYAGDWLDLSTGINPFAYPLPPLLADDWTRLPSAAALDDLLAAARKAYGCTVEAGIVALPGTQAAIQVLPRLFKPARVTILGPTYAEHAYAWGLLGHSVTELEGLPGNLADTDILVVVNPNNPDGRVVEPEILRHWRQALAAKGGVLVIDEAFADVTPEASLAKEAGTEGLIVLRSFGKFFGLAGLRLGFVLAQPAMAEALRASLGPWAVSGPALTIGAAALNDAAWQAAMRNELRARAERFDLGLRARGIPVLGGTSLYRLAEIPDAAKLAAALRQQGVHVRIFKHQPHWMRFGLPADETEFWRRFDAAL